MVVPFWPAADNHHDESDESSELQLATRVQTSRLVDSTAQAELGMSSMHGTSISGPLLNTFMVGGVATVRLETVWCM